MNWEIIIISTTLLLAIFLERAHTKPFHCRNPLVFSHPHYIHQRGTLNSTLDLDEASSERFLILMWKSMLFENFSLAEYLRCFLGENSRRLQSSDYASINIKEFEVHRPQQSIRSRVCNLTNYLSSNVVVWCNRVASSWYKIPK